MNRPAESPLRSRIAAGMSDARVIRAVHLATLHKVETRAFGMAQLRDYEGLRSLAAEIKRRTLARLGEYLEQFIGNLERRGGVAHFAPDAAAARRIIVEIARRAGARRIVKAKSMATEEVHLNDALIAAGMEVVETDLGEFIVQLDRDRPSHIVTPIIHKDRRSIAATMQRELGCAYTEDPVELTHIARRHLREVFRRCELGISGVNFGVADTGSIVVCTNEGNGRMTTTRPRVHVALMGIEKLIPRLRDLPVFLKLLARSSTGQPLTVYTSVITGPRRAGDADGPEALHVVLLDAGRSALLGGPFEDVLRCIRCGACLNACPVYRNIGGHAYGGIYNGPIGKLLTPLLTPARDAAELPRVSSLCGACYAACPVKIDIPSLLVRLRERDRSSPMRRAAMRAWRWMMSSPRRYQIGQWLLRVAAPADIEGWVTGGIGPVGSWTRVRDLRAPAAQSFRDRWRRELRNDQ